MFWRSICPIFGQEKDSFLATTVRKLFDENISNQFYLRISFQVFNQLLCFMFKILLNDILINNFNIYLLCILTCMRMKLPMMAVLSSQTANDGHSKQSDLKYTMVVLL